MTQKFDFMGSETLKKESVVFACFGGLRVSCLFENCDAFRNEKFGGLWCRRMGLERCGEE